MQHRTFRFLTGAAGAAVVLTLAACAETGPTGIGEFDPELNAATNSTLLKCPTNETLSTTKTLGEAGGTVDLEGYRLTVPANALSRETDIELTVPASRFVMIEVRADGQKDFAFQETVSLTIDYSRCNGRGHGYGRALENTRLTAWKIDADTNELLKHMGGEDDKAERAVTFPSDSLSSYAIAR